MSSATIEVRVNGEARVIQCAVRMSAADFIRCELELTGTRVGCEHGVCGTCTILLDGRAVRSCLLLAPQLDGTDVVTVEGLADGSQLSRLQEAFRMYHALQCGFCTAGMLLTATELMSDQPGELTRDQVRTRLSGNICRCTGYSNIVSAIVAAADSQVQLPADSEYIQHRAGPYE